MDITGAADHGVSVSSLEAGNHADALTENGVSVVSDGLDASSSIVELSTDTSTGVAATIEPNQVNGSPPSPDTQSPAAPVPPEASVTTSVSSGQNDPPMPSASVSVSDTISVSVAAPHPDLSTHSIEQSADHVGYPDIQVPVSHIGGTSLLAASMVPTLLDIQAEDGGGTTLNGDGDYEEHSSLEVHSGEIEVTQLEYSPEPPASPTSNTIQSTSSTSTYRNSSQPLLKSELKGGKTPSANRLSISYAGGNRRLVVNAEVVDKLKVFRQDGRIEVHMNIDKDSDVSLKGILVSFFLPHQLWLLTFCQVEGLSDATKSYLPLPTIPDSDESDPTLPPFSKVPIPSTLALIVYLDTARPLSEPKWAKSGDIQEWLKSMFGRMFWVAGDAAEGWEKKILVIDPDPVSFFSVSIFFTTFILR